MDKYVSIKDIEEAALQILPKPARDYYKSGATDEQTLFENKLAFQRCVLESIRFIVNVHISSYFNSSIGNSFLLWCYSQV